MPLPLIAVGAGAMAGVTGLIVRALTIFFVAKGAMSVIRIFAMLGIAWGTYQWVIEPLIAEATSRWNGLPADLKTWIGAFGIDVVVSIMLSAYALWGVKKLFLQKAL